MLDVLETIFEFLQGLAYAGYTSASALSDGVDFLFSAVPYVTNFLSVGHTGFISSCCLLLVGLGIIRLLWVGGGD